MKVSLDFTAVSTVDAPAIARLQLSSQRYYNRPDATHVEFDPTATSLGGWTGSINLNRQSGVHGFNAALWSVSPGFDSSDVGGKDIDHVAVNAQPRP